MPQTITIPNAKKELIEGVHYESTGGGPLVVICHGLNGSHTHPAIDAITQNLANDGHSVFAFNYSRGAQSIQVDAQVKDIIAITNYFNNPNIVIIGGSFGALSASISAATNNVIKALITVNGFFGTDALYGNTKKMFHLFKVASYVSPMHRRAFTYFRKELKPNAIHIPSLIIYAENDEIIHTNQSKQFFTKLRGNKQLHAVAKADHHLTNKASRDEVSSVISKWIYKLK